MTEVKILTLYKTMFFNPDTETDESLVKYTSTVTKKTLEPPKSLLEDRIFCGFSITQAQAQDAQKKTTAIEAGKYLFIQFTEGNREKAAESLWLESLWLDIDVSPDVYERTLIEDGKTVFQLFRKIQ